MCFNSTVCIQGSSVSFNYFFGRAILPNCVSSLDNAKRNDGRISIEGMTYVSCANALAYYIVYTHFVRRREDFCARNVIKSATKGSSQKKNFGMVYLECFMCCEWRGCRKQENNYSTKIPRWQYISIHIDCTESTSSSFNLVFGNVFYIKLYCLLLVYGLYTVSIACVFLFLLLMIMEKKATVRLWMSRFTTYDIFVR